MPKSSLSLSFKLCLLLCMVAMLTASAAAQPPAGAHTQLLQLVDKDAAHWQQISKQIWDYAELIS